jgi:hypothetical protein
MNSSQSRISDALQLLELHHQSFYAAESFATLTGHPVPMDTRGWSQILASVLSGVSGLARQKGADLIDGSDVKAANTWKAIDTPRFNGVIKAGTKAGTSGKLESLDSMPHLYLVLWDETARGEARCRIWVIRTQEDKEFRNMCEAWYKQRDEGKIVSSNFQLHPPRGKDTNVIKNTLGVFEYPLLFSAVKENALPYKCEIFDESVLTEGLCRKVL